MKAEEMKHELERLRKENEALRSQGVSVPAIRVSQKGAVSVTDSDDFP